MRDEILATKACGDLGLPLFVVITPSPSSKVRNVRLGWVSDYDDSSGQILILFSDQPIALDRADPGETDDRDFDLQVSRKSSRTRTKTLTQPDRDFGSRCSNVMAPDVLCAKSPSPICSTRHISAPPKRTGQMILETGSCSVSLITGPSTWASS